MKIEKIKPIELKITTLLQFDERELPPSPMKSKSLLSYRLTELIKNRFELDLLPKGFYALALTYIAPTNRARTRITKKVKRYLLQRISLENGFLDIICPYPQNLDFPPIKKWEPER